jgi:ribosome maturation factor RimP
MRCVAETFPISASSGNPMSVDDKTGEISAIINKVADDLGYLIYEFSILMKGGNSYIVVRIDRIEGISIGDCEMFSRELTSRLDESSLLPLYTLEVSSPGLTRKIRTISEFQRFIGSPVKIVYFKDEKKDVVKGLLQDVSGNSIVVSSEAGEVIIDFEKVDRATLDY